MAASLQGQGVSLIPVGATGSNGSGAIGVTGALWQLIGANMNSTADQPFTQLFPFSTFIIDSIRITSASGSLSGAIGGIYTGANKTGTIIVASTQVYSGVTGPTSIVNLTITAAGTALQTSVASLILSLTTALGSAGTASIFVMGTALG